MNAKRLAPAGKGADGALKVDKPYRRCNLYASFANLIVTLRFAKEETWPWLRSDIHRQLADFSFSVYAVLMPLLMFMPAAAAWIFGDDWLGSPVTPRQCVRSDAT